MMHIYVLSIPLLLMNLQIMSGEIASFNRKQLHKRNSPVAEQDLEVLELDQPIPRAEHMPELGEVMEDVMTTEPAVQIVETPIFDTEYDELGHMCTPDKKIIENLLQKYKTHKTPSEEGVIVWIEVWVQEVNSVNEITSDFDMDIYVTELWVDQALRYDDMNPCKYNLSLSNEILDHIWKPNTVFINSKSATIHKSPFSNIFLMIYPNGTVWVNYRVQVKGPCMMDFTSFPMDEQTCLLTFQSFNYNNQEVDMQWINTTAPLIFLRDHITLPDFVLTSYNTTTAHVMYPAGIWNELTMTFTFTRRYGWYIFQAYVPTYLTIFISWISFCLSAKMIPARTMLGVNSLIALTFQFGNIMRNLPRVSYIKALDVWMLSCLSFVFCSLLELAIIGSINARSEAAAVKKPMKKRSSRSPSTGTTWQSPVVCRKDFVEEPPRSISPIDPRMRRRILVSPPGSRLITRNIINRRHSSASRCSQQERILLLDTVNISKPRRHLRRARLSLQNHASHWTADRIDRLSIMLFPSLFTIFNIIYWSYYLSRTR